MRKIIDIETGCDGRAIQAEIVYNDKGASTISFTFYPQIPIELAEKMRPAIAKKAQIKQTHKHSNGHAIKV